MGLPLAVELQGITPPPRENLQERVYRELRRALMSGLFPPGRALTIRAMAAALGTSVMPVREALRQLVAERAVVVRPNRSFATPRMTRTAFADLTRIRVHIEGFAAAEAARRMTPATLRALQALNEAMAEAEAAHDGRRYVELNHQFRFTLYEAADSPVLLPIIESLWLQIGPYLTFLFTEDGAVVSLAPHRALLAALRRRDPAAAQAALARDIGEAAALLERVATFDEEKQ
jgi:DNA-binding GntR family transcriptional regulator